MGRLLEIVRSLFVPQLRPRDFASAGQHLCRAQGVAIFRFLCTLYEFLRLTQRHQLGILGVLQEPVRIGQSPGFQRLGGEPDDFGDMRILWFKRRHCVAGLREMLSDLDQSLRNLFQRRVVLAKDAEKLADRSRGESQFRG